MTCQEFREMIDRDGAPTTGEANAHIHDCPSCAEFVETWQEVRRGLHEMGEEEPPPFLHTRLMAHVREAAEADSRKKEAWFFGLKKIWAGPLLVLFLGMLLGGYGLMQVLKPRPVSAPVQAPPMTLQDKTRGAAGKIPSRSDQGLGQEGALKEKAQRQDEASSPENTRPEGAGLTAEGDVSPPAPAAPVEVTPGPALEEDKKRARGGSLFETAPAPGPASSEPYQPLSNSAGALQGSEDAAQGRAPVPKDKAVARAQPSAAGFTLGTAPESLARSGDEPSEVVCTLSPLSGSGPFITLQLPAGAAPPSGGIWTVQVPQEGIPRVQDAVGKPVASAPLATLTAILRPLRVPPGSYKLKRIS
jgi:anti-sigma factor RsiW